MNIKFDLLKNILICCFCLIVSQLQAQDYWQQKVDYKMNVRLHPNDNTLDAFARIQYTNHSPDTLHFIWFHIWPNAFKNDRTAYSDHELENGNKTFYFSSNEEKGYINRLDFRVDEQVLKTEDHPEHIDIIKVYLPAPLAPEGTVSITTPFHVKLPYNFSRSGYFNKTYQVTQWYPKPAVYDRNGWHPMPYLDQGEFYSEFGDYEVTITVPEKFTVAATGEPLVKPKEVLSIPPTARKTKKPTVKTKNPQKPYDWNSAPTATYIYKQERVHDFAWFADTSFTLQTDTIRLPSGKTVNLQVYFHLNKLDIWENAMTYLKEAIWNLSAWVGEYPYNYATVVDGKQGFAGGMEYPTITILSGMSTPADLDLTIFHEVGHNWFYGALATNERKAPWMDEGMNSYYTNRYEALKYKRAKKPKGFQIFSDPRFPELMLRTQAGFKTDQPMTTPADSFTANNYQLIAYTKSALWMKKLETDLGRNLFDKSMHQYYDQWKFKHPGRSDFQTVVSNTSGKQLDSTFALLDEKGSVPPDPKRPLQIVPLYKIEKTIEHTPIFITPIATYNTFNGIAPGIAIHNYSLPLPRLNFAIAPFYGIKSAKLNGWGRVAYQWYPDEFFSHIEVALVASKFNQKNFRDSMNNLYSLAVQKLSPSLKFIFKENYARSNFVKFIQFKYVMIGEDELDFAKDPNNNSTIITREKARYSVLQSRFVIQNNRELYPWNAEILTEGHEDFYKLSLTGNYFFNFRKKGGVNLRFFTGKFFYRGDNTSTASFETQRFHLNMSGPKGFEDYTYANPFIGRFEFDGFANQQIMIRDGAFKVRTDLLAEEVGRTDDWLSAINLTMDVPDRFNIFHALPLKIPLKLFVDVGTYSGVWSKNSGESKFLYDGGVQVSLLNNLVNFYFPLVYSKVYRDYFNSTPGNNFFQRMSFSINIQDQSIKKITQMFKQ